MAASANVVGEVVKCRSVGDGTRRVFLIQLHTHRLAFVVSGFQIATTSWAPYGRMHYPPSTYYKQGSYNLTNEYTFEQSAALKNGTAPPNGTYIPKLSVAESKGSVVGHKEY